jgi:hypothetical protein
MRLSEIIPDYEEAGYDAKFTEDMSIKMQVPRNIRINGGGDGNENDDVNRNWNRANGYNVEKFDMQVPDRIVVRGQDQHLGTKALPREFQLDSAGTIPQHDSDLIRILTPPRTITLRDQPIQDYQALRNKYENEDDTLVISNNRARFMPSMPNGGINVGMIDSTISLGLGDNREGALDTGFYDADVQAELDHFRDQFKRLSNRVTVCEADLKDRMEREKYIMYAGGVYLALQIFKWLFRSNQH